MTEEIDDQIILKLSDLKNDEDEREMTLMTKSFAFSMSDASVNSWNGMYSFRSAAMDEKSKHELSLVEC